MTKKNLTTMMDNIVDIIHENYNKNSLNFSEKHLDIHDPAVEKLSKLVISVINESKNIDEFIKYVNEIELTPMSMDAWRAVTGYDNYRDEITTSDILPVLSWYAVHTVNDRSTVLNDDQVDKFNRFFQYYIERSKYAEMGKISTYGIIRSGRIEIDNIVFKCFINRYLSMLDRYDGMKDYDLIDIKLASNVEFSTNYSQIRNGFADIYHFCINGIFVTITWPYGETLKNDIQCSIHCADEDDKTLFSDLSDCFKWNDDEWLLWEMKHYNETTISQYIIKSTPVSVCFSGIWKSL